MAELAAENGTIDAKLAEMETSHNAQLANLAAKNDRLTAKLTKMEAQLALIAAENGTLDAAFLAKVEAKLLYNG